MRRIAGDFLFTADKSEISCAPIRHGCVTADDEGRIIEVEQLDNETIAKAAERKRSGYVRADGELEYFEGVICPGFVNAHSHIELSHLKGHFKEATGMSGFINQINELRCCVNEEERAAAMKAEFESFYNQGIAGVSDISNCAESFEFKKNSKTYFRTFIELFGSEPSDAQDVLSGGIRLAAQARAMGLDASVTPHSCYTMSPKLLEITAEEGLKSGFISYHSQESKEEEDMIMYGTGALEDNYKGRHLSVPPVTGRTALEYFVDRLLTFSNSPVKGKINLIHNVALSGQSIDYALEHIDTPYFTICPLSNIFIHRALPPLDLMRKRRLRICIGTDSLSSNKVLSMIAEMKCIQDNFSSVSLGEILGWACHNGAEVIGKENELGSITPGKKPGIVLITNIDYKNFKLTEESVSERIA